MIGLHDDDSELNEPPETTPLRGSIDAFTASLTAAHPCIFSRSPVCDLEHLAALLHMSLDSCRELLDAYDALASTDAIWLFDAPRDDETDGRDDHGEPDDDIPF